METTLEPIKGRFDASATRLVCPRAFVGETLAGSLLLKAMAAGWLTQQDIATVVPILAFQQEVAIRVVRHIGGKGLAADGTLRESLSVLERQQLQYDKALCAMGSVRWPEETMPGFAKHFARQCLIFGEQVSDEAANNICVVLVVLQTQVLAKVVRGLEKASVVGLQFASPVDEWCGTKATFCETTEAVAAQHLEFLEELHAFTRSARLCSMSDRIQARVSLEREMEPPIAMFPGIGEIICEERDDQRGIDFTVERYPCTAEVLDPRVVRIPPGKTNNRHKHAHETLFYFVEGYGEILVGEKWISVKPGDAVFYSTYFGLGHRIKLHDRPGVFKASLAGLSLGSYLLRGMEEHEVNGHILDLGTGSGVLALLLRSMGAKNIAATDISRAAVTLAQDNERLNFDAPLIRFSTADLFNGLPTDSCYDTLIFNPPGWRTPSPNLLAELNSKCGQHDIDPQAMFYGDEVLLRFLHELPPYINQRGRALVGLNSLVGIRNVFNRYLADHPYAPR